MNYDALVIGGGTSGIASAISLAKKNLKVAIIERTNCLGGTQTNAIVTPFMPSFAKTSEIGKEIIDSYLQIEKDHKKVYFEKTISFNTELYKYNLDTLVKKYNIDVFFDTTIYDVALKGKEIDYIKCIDLFNKFNLKATYYIDATGNLLVGKLANIKYNQGDENKKNQASSLRFEIANIDLIKLRKYLKEINYTFCSLEKEYLEFVYVPNNPTCSGLKDKIQEALNHKDINEEDARYIQGFTIPSADGVLSFNGPQIPNVYDLFNPLEYSQINLIGREMQQRLFKFFQKYIPGFENSFISKSATMLGIRESRRLDGVYELNSNDYKKRSKFEHSVAQGDWYIDIHDDSLDVEDKEFKSKYDAGEYYEIPYESLISKELSNCLFVGKHISATFKMQSSIRIQPTCYMMTDVLGDIFSYCKKENIAINDVEKIGDKIKWIK